MWPAQQLFFAVAGVLLIHSSTKAQEVCSNGIPGVETGSVCCVAECGACGGTGCRDRATAVGLTADDCCSQRISDSTVYCEDSGTAPCIIGPTCSNGVFGVENFGVCCVAECGTCGGASCRDRAEAVGLTADDCCTQRVSTSGVFCNDSETAPCIIGSAPTCSNGVVGIEDFGVCCMADCGTCGGAGCRDRAEAVGLTADDCCTQRISDSGMYCDDSETAPCIIGSAPTCSNGVPGVEADGTCCVAECGTCGGAGCRDRAEAVGLDADDCCTQRISDSGVHCDDSEAAPCIVNNEVCDPSLIITLEWSDVFSDLDLYVIEPLGSIVFHENRAGNFGYLDNDDTQGYGPENYIIFSGLDPEGLVLGEYRAQVQRFNGTAESWTLTARTFGEVVWIEEGNLTTADATQFFNVSLTDYDPNCRDTFSTTFTSYSTSYSS